MLKYSLTTVDTIHYRCYAVPYFGDVKIFSFEHYNSIKLTIEYFALPKYSPVYDL